MTILELKSIIAEIKILPESLTNRLEQAEEKASKYKLIEMIWSAEQKEKMKKNKQNSEICGELSHISTYA